VKDELRDALVDEYGEVPQKMEHMVLPMYVTSYQCLVAKSGIPNSLVPVAVIYFLAIALLCLSVVNQVVAYTNICLLGLESKNGMGGSLCPDFAPGALSGIRSGIPNQDK